MKGTARNPVKSVRTTLTIIEGLKELDGAGVTELAAHLDKPKSTVHNYLSTLEAEEYVVSEGTEYHVGTRFLEFGTYVRYRHTIYEIARSEIDRLAEETGELANLMIEEHGRGIYLHRAQGRQAVNVDANAGTRVYLHSTGLGKAILAHLPEERVDAIVDTHGLPEITENTVTDRSTLDRRLGEIRERGYAIDDEERLPGLRCIAAPILSNENRVLGAISVSAPTHRLRDDQFQTTMPNKVREVANVIELNITYS